MLAGCVFVEAPRPIRSTANTKCYCETPHHCLGVDRWSAVPVRREQPGSSLVLYHVCYSVINRRVMAVHHRCSPMPMPMILLTTISHHIRRSLHDPITRSCYPSIRPALPGIDSSIPGPLNHGLATDFAEISPPRTCATRCHQLHEDLKKPTDVTARFDCVGRWHLP